MLRELVGKFNKHHDKKAEIHLDAARRGGIIAIYRLFNRYYLKSFFGPFFAFVFPVMFYAILGSIMNAKLLFAGMIALSALSTGMQGLPFSVFELKKSVLLKRIGASPVKSSTFTLAIITYYATTIILSIFWLMLWALILFRDVTVFYPLGDVVSLLGFIYGNFLNIIVSVAIGFSLASIAKSEVQIQAIGFLLYFPSTFLSGQFLTIDLVASSDAMNWISRFIPYRYTTMIIVESWTGSIDFTMPPIPGAAQRSVSIVGNPFLIHDYATIKEPKFNWHKDIPQQLNDIGSNYPWALTIYDKADHICGYVVPYVALFGTGIFSIKKFTWSTR